MKQLPFLFFLGVGLSIIATGVVGLDVALFYIDILPEVCKTEDGQLRSCVVMPCLLFFIYLLIVTFVAWFEVDSYLTDKKE